ncbi:MAG TPA: sulfotransferase [Candidatus Methylomirabilis sp.]|nr:sulfotransferase [Candidatus Methylomirabilis sp.]
MTVTIVSAGIRTANALGAVLRRVGVPFVSLDEQDLLDAARRATGLDDFGDDSFREPLRHLLACLETEADLTLVGRIAAHRDLVGLLINRLHLTEDRKRHPEIADESIVAPIFIVGLPRTGSTLLHHLLAQDPTTRAAQAWEVMYPSPPPTRESYETDPRIERARKQLRWLDWMAPDFKTIHPVGAQLPLECIAIMGASFRSTRFQTTYNVPSYEAWLDDQDMRPAYVFHRQFLQHLQWRAPGARWVLKAPSHVFSFDALLDAYPDARLVQTHRDPVTVLASVASLSSVLQRAFSGRREPTEFGQEVTTRWTDGLERSLELRRSGRVSVERVVDVQYRELARDPMATVRRVYAQFQLPLSPAAERRMQQFLAEHHQDKHGRHHYALDNFGLDAQALALRFKAYSDYFGVPSELPARR